MVELNVNEQRWETVLATLNLAPDPQEFFHLAEAYSQPHRAYHNLRHLTECLEKLDWARSHDVEPLANEHEAALAEAALLYHDVVYEPKANDNERQSAQWAVRFFSGAGLSASDCQRVESLIMATRHGEKPVEPLHQLVVDVDLAILGAPPARFDEYEQQIRQEYQWAPASVYNTKRRELLERFLAAPRIFCSELFYNHWERSARENLKQSIRKLTHAP